MIPCTCRIVARRDRNMLSTFVRVPSTTCARHGAVKPQPPKETK